MSSYLLSVYEISEFITYGQYYREHTNYVVDCLQEDLSSQFVAVFPEGIVINHGGVITCDDKIFEDTQPYGIDPHQLLHNKGNYAFGHAQKFDGRLVVLSSPGQENWYHWLLQVLPRLKILSQSGIAYDKIYINDLHYRWQKDSLQKCMHLLNISQDKLLLFDGDVIIQAKELLVPSVPFIPSKNRKVIPIWCQRFLHDTFLKNHYKNTPKKIFISRAKASMRRITNDVELMELLKKYGFELLHLEDMVPCQQADIFYNAQMIIAPHGSAFANLIFCKPGTQVIEIDHALQGEEQRSYFKRFAELMECDYAPFYVDVVDEQDIEQDMLVDIVAFEQFLQKYCIEMVCE